MPHRDEISWTTIISGYVASSDTIEALTLFHTFLLAETLSPDPFLLSLALKACTSSISLLPHGEAIHALTLKAGTLLSVFVGSSLVDMYSRSKTSAALRVFDEMPFRNALSHGLRHRRICPCRALLRRPHVVSLTCGRHTYPRFPHLRHRPQGMRGRRVYPSWR
ncbi:hypothetical protein HPP92_006165 [Vanilla planifolia]|uniref:Pentatricopeptide repeat-containing protein n=1 Tax=Vanilla planifolia TaxID=51239 RepID=A0A835RVY4_VANPL|nr:hypothetical protein HPP92_006165 [Vanilla planifolia]